MKIAFLISIMLMANAIIAQATIKVEVSSDTVHVGEVVELKYTFENGEGHFTPPDMSGLPLASGPNVSSSFMIVNGKKSSSQSYTYILRHGGEGEIRVPKSYNSENGKSEEIESILITIVSTIPDTPSKSTSTNSLKIIREKKKF